MGFGPFPDTPDATVTLIEGPWTHRFVRANGIGMHVAELGTGPLVLLLHGFPQFWWAWRQQLVDLADAGFRAVAVDLRGYGASDKPRRGYDTPTLAADVAALVTSLGESSALVVGSDVGGTVAWAVAARHPQVVRGIVVIGAAHPLRMRQVLFSRGGAEQRHASSYALRTFQIPRRPENLMAHDSRWIRSLYERWSGPAWRASPDFASDVERYAEAMRIHPVAYCASEHFRWVGRSMVRGDGRRFFRTMRRPITAPVLQLHGALDTCVIPSSAQGSGRHVTGMYRWRMLEGTGHLVHDEQPETVSGELVAFAKQA